MLRFLCSVWLGLSLDPGREWSSCSKFFSCCHRPEVIWRWLWCTWTCSSCWRSCPPWLALPTCLRLPGKLTPSWISDNLASGDNIRHPFRSIGSFPCKFHYRFLASSEAAHLATYLTKRGRAGRGWEYMNIERELAAGYDTQLAPRHAPGHPAYPLPSAPSPTFEILPSALLRLLPALACPSYLVSVKQLEYQGKRLKLQALRLWHANSGPSLEFTLVKQRSSIYF